MKNTRKNFLLSALALLLASASVFTACKKDPEEIAALLSESEAAEILEASMSERTAGTTAPTVDMAEILESLLDDCGVPGDTSIAKSDVAGPATYTYNADIDWLVNCNNLNIPIDADFDVSSAATFSSTRWNGTDQTTGSITFTGLDLQSPAYIANGSYELTGTLTGNLRKVDPVLNCILDLNLTNLTLDKDTYAITGGTGTFTLTASTAAGQNASYSGSLVFNADGTVTVTIGGHTHTFEG